MSQNVSLHVDGRMLRDRVGRTIVLRGVNLPLLDDWSFPTTDFVAEVARTGANVVRIQWYMQYPSADRPLYGLSDLDAVLARCKAAGMISIVQLADLTCNGDSSLLMSQVVPWWSAADTVAMLNRHADCLIINLANELGFYHWAPDANAALSGYVDAYSQGLTTIRKAGLAMPVMIDAPDCGTSLDAFTSAGSALLARDPLRNTLLSAHAYWAANDHGDLLPACVRKGIPVVFGEISNKQDNTDEAGTLIGYFDLDGTGQNTAPTSGFTYQALLKTLLDHQIGWLAWSWGPDKCPARMLSADGSFANLTPYGQDIVNNPIYGLKATASRPA